MVFRITLTILVALLSTAVRATTLSVPGDYGTISAAAAIAADGDIIEIAAGTYIEYNIDLVSGVTVRGATGTPAEVMIDLNAAGYLFNIIGATKVITLEAVTVMNSAGDDPVLRSESAGPAPGDVVIRNCRFDACVSAGSASIVGMHPYASPLALDIENTVFENCAAADGASVASFNTMEPVDFRLEGVTVSNCTGGTAFSMNGYRASGTIANCQFTTNTGSALYAGGYNSGSLVVTNSAFVENSCGGPEARSVSPTPFTARSTVRVSSGIRRAGPEGPSGLRT